MIQTRNDDFARTDNNGFAMEFRLYSVATGGAPFWEELWTGSNAVQVSDGLFNVMLGSLDPILQSIVTGNASLFLGISADTDDGLPETTACSVPVSKNMRVGYGSNAEDGYMTKR